MLRDSNGSWVEKKEELESMILNFFKMLFTEEVIDRTKLITNMAFSVISEDQNRDLLKNITNEEIKKAMFSMGDLKAPGEDGFPTIFYQKNWDIVGQSIYQFVLDFLRVEL